MLKTTGRNRKSGASRLASWGIFLTVLFTVGTGFNPGSLKRCGCNVTPEEVARFQDMTGRILAARDNAPIAGATIDLGDQMTTSNQLGEFLFPGVAPGEYPFMVTAPGYQDWEQLITWPPPSDAPLTILLLAEGIMQRNLPVADAKVSVNEPILNFAEDELLCFEWGVSSLSGQGGVYSYIDFDLSVIPPKATLQSVRMYATRFESSPGGAGNEDIGNGDSPSRLGSSGALEEADIVLDAYAVLEGWSEGELMFLNRPREFSTDPVASVTLASVPPSGSLSFVMDLTQFAADRLEGRTEAAGFILVSRDPLSKGGGFVHYISSSEYEPVERALRIVAEYVDVTGKTVEVTLR